MTKQINIGIIRCSSIGDVVLTTASITTISKLYKNVQIFWFGTGTPLKLIQESYPNIKAIEIKNKDINCHLKKIDILIDFQVNLRSLLILFRYKFTTFNRCYIHKKNSFQRISYIIKSYLFGRTQTHQKKSTLTYQYQQIIATTLKALKMTKSEYKNLTNVETNTLKPQLLVSNLVEKQNTTKKNVTYICLAPGASYKTKRAPVEVFHTIFYNISTYYETTSLKKPTVIILGDKNDITIAEQISQKLYSIQFEVINLTGKLMLQQLPEVIKKSKVVICNDSAIGHISEAIDIPVVSLFGPTSENFGFAPHLKKSKVFSSSIGCRPCSKHGKHPCRYSDHKCFTQLDKKHIGKTIFNIAVNNDKN